METVMQSRYKEALKRAGHLAQVADHHGALAAYDKAIRLAPCRADAHYEMGLLHHKLGQLAEAVACFERAAELAPEDATVWNNLGVLSFSQGALEKAAACLERAIEIDPKYVDSLLNAAKVLAKLGRIEQAEHRLRRCLQIQPGSQGAMRLLQDLGIEIDRPMTWSPRPTATAKLSRLPGRERIRIRVLTHAELEKDLAKRKQWADFWVKQELERELESFGLAVVEQDPDVILYLFGVPVRGLPKNTYNMVWVYSHPDMVTPGNLRGFHRIFSLSSSYARKLRSMGYGDVEVMIGATSKKPLEREKQHDVVFVGSSRGLHGRKIVTDLGDAPYNLKVWGRGWDQLLPERFYGGSYYDYEKLSELYASALVSLNDHHPDMAREGFVSVRIFDILASGGFAISDRNAGIEEIFGDAVPQYESPKHLRELLDFYLTHPEERLKLAKEGREIALSHTWRKRAKQFARAALQGMEGQRAGHLRSRVLSPSKTRPADVLVSVIMPTYDRACIIGRSINSVLRQSLASFELIIIDDASRDHTEEIVGRYDDARIRFIKRTLNHLELYRTAGVIDNPRNDGLKVARGKYICYLDSDDMFRPSFLSTMSTYLDRNPHVGLAYCDSLWHRRIKRKEEASCIMSFDFDMELMRKRNFIATLTVMHRREIVNEVGFFKPIKVRCPHPGIPYIGIEDWDYWLRIAEHFKIAHLPVVLGDIMDKTSDFYWDKDFTPEFDHPARGTRV